VNLAYNGGIPPGDLYLFTDGRFLKDKLIRGSGIVIMNHNFEIIHSSGTCYFPVFSSAHIEKLSMKEGKEKTALIYEFLSAQTIIHCMDTMSVLRSLPSWYHPSIISFIHSQLTFWKQLTWRGEYIHQWVPAHTGMQGNEAADEQATRAMDSHTFQLTDSTKDTSTGKRNNYGPRSPLNGIKLSCNGVSICIPQESPKTRQSIFQLCLQAHHEQVPPQIPMVLTAKSSCQDMPVLQSTFLLS
jgi:ribonuclease HI